MRRTYLQRVFSLSTDQLLERLREELHRRLLWEDAPSGYDWETLDRVSGVLQVDPVSFCTDWLQPLLIEGLDLQMAMASIAESILLPN
jgi:hypothetical protein